MASTKTTKKKNPVSTNSSKQPTAKEIRDWYNKYSDQIAFAERSKDALQLIDTTKNSSKSFTIFSKEKFRQYMRNPLVNAKNLRDLSRYLYYRSHVYRRIINYHANMIDLNARSVIPLVDIIKGVDETKMLKVYYETLLMLEGMNLPLALLPSYVIAWREDVFYGCAYYDDDGTFFILPMPADYCKITSVYPGGDYGFDMDMSYFRNRQELLELWGEPFQSMYRQFETGGNSAKFVPMPDENCVCFKVNNDSFDDVLPPFLALFDALISLEDLKDVVNIAQEQDIYQLLAFTLPMLKNADGVDEFAVDPDTAIAYYNRALEELNEYTNAILTPVPVEAINFTKDKTGEVNRIEEATKNIMLSSGGSQVLAGGTGSTSVNLSMKADENYALSSLLPQTEAWLNRFISYHIKDAAKVKFMEVTAYTKDEFKNSLRQDATYGLPVKLELNALNGFSALETISKAHLEKALGLTELFVPLQSSNTQDTGNLSNPEGGRPTKSDGEISEDGEKSRDTRENRK